MFKNKLSPDAVTSAVLVYVGINAIIVAKPRPTNTVPRKIDDNVAIVAVESLNQIKSILMKRFQSLRNERSCCHFMKRSNQLKL